MVEGATPSANFVHRQYQLEKRMTIDWEPLGKIINDHQRFVLTSHVRPDADALGSEIGMARILVALGKQVKIVNQSPTPPRLGFIDTEGWICQLGKSATAEEALDTDVHIILDTSAWGQLQDMGKILGKTDAVKVVIDHHVSSDDLGAIVFKNTTAAATGEMVYELAVALGYTVDAIAATALYCAIVTDTGWFRFPSSTVNTMRVGAALMELGANPAALYEQLYEQYSLARMRLAGRSLQRITPEFDGLLTHTYIRWDDYAETGAVPPDTEDLVNECMRIAGAQAAFILIEQSNRQVKCSFRSRVGINVAAVAEQFGGGGHQQAAGTILPGPISDARQKVLAALRPVMEQVKKAGG
ncbi:NanoRNase/pAp phosphatase [Symmachiella dynata]|nr:NanoRNase/pAp phosphatase [Symmachiella dynata]